MDIVHAKAEDIDECLFVSRFRGFRHHGKEPFLSDPSNPALPRLVSRLMRSFKRLRNLLQGSVGCRKSLEYNLKFQKNFRLKLRDMIWLGRVTEKTALSGP